MQDIMGIYRFGFRYIQTYYKTNLLERVIFRVRLLFNPHHEPAHLKGQNVQKAHH